MIQGRTENWVREDPLTYLPRKSVQEFGKGRVIYSPTETSERLYLVVLGRVKVSTTPDFGTETIARIICPEGLFGESALVGGRTEETAVALDTATLMSWTRPEIEQQIDREPKLGLALAQYLVRNCMALQDRIESMAAHKTPERVMVALVQLADLVGSSLPDGATRIGSLTHHTIAEYIGTSREIVTFQMNRLRKLGLIRYTRRYIDVYVHAVEEMLRQQGVSAPREAGPARRRATHTVGA
ncbi:MAG: Crp/Fnr family transcriptional regulator [Acidobacteriia bacterium]|nr:Crp/Fnr family transcriptional regulator [Terriglobia bacterium]